MTTLTYNPDIFATPDLEAARRIIVTTEGGRDTDERWARETPYLAELIGQELALKPGMVVLDYGCGVGRIAKALIERFGCSVLGVDISQEMRGLAPSYVGSAAFSVVSRRMLQQLVAAGLRVDAALSVWVLQHCANPAEDIDLIRSALTPAGAFTVVNNLCRAVPTVEKRWVNDLIDVAALLDGRLAKLRSGHMDAEAVGPHVAELSFWATYQAA